MILTPYARSRRSRHVEFRHRAGPQRIPALPCPVRPTESARDRIALAHPREKFPLEPAERRGSSARPVRGSRRRSGPRGRAPPSPPGSDRSRRREPCRRERRAATARRPRERVQHAAGCLLARDAHRPQAEPPAEPHRGRHHPGAHAQTAPGDPGRRGCVAAGRGIPADGGFGAEEIEGAAAAGRHAANALDIGEHGVECPHRVRCARATPGWRSLRKSRRTGFPRAVRASASASCTSTTPKAPAGSRSTGEGEPTEETQAKYAPPLRAPTSRSLKTKATRAHDQLTRASATRPR